MNTNGLAKLYDRLTPRERVPLMIAAYDRGDHAEAERLSRAAPRYGVTLPDYHGFGEGMILAALFHMLVQLDLIAVYRQVEGVAEVYWEVARTKEQQAKAERLSDGLSALAYKITVEAEAWERFCGELKIDPDTLLRDLPCYGTLKRGENSAKVGACTAEEAAALWREAGGASPPTVEAAARAMHDLIAQREEWWG